MNNFTKRERDVLSQYTIEDVMTPKWKFWREDLTHKVGYEMMKAGVWDKANYMLALQHLRSGKNLFEILGGKAYCPNCKMIVNPLWFGGAYPESYSVECPHCSFLFAEE